MASSNTPCGSCGSTEWYAIRYTYDPDTKERTELCSECPENKNPATMGIVNTFRPTASKPDFLKDIYAKHFRSMPKTRDAFLTKLAQKRASEKKT